MQAQPTPAPEQLVRIVLRPYGSALPLGFFAFGFGTVLVAALGLHWVPVDEGKIVAVTLLAFVAPLELIACIFAFLSRDGAGGTSMGIFAASWVAYALFLLTSAPGATSRTVGIFTAMECAVILELALVAIRGKPLLAILLVLAMIRSLCSALHQFDPAVQVYSLVSSAIGILLGAFSLYGGIAFLMEDVNRRTILPLFRRGAAQDALEGDLGTQLRRITHEAGVRQQL